MVARYKELDGGQLFRSQFDSKIDATYESISNYVSRDMEGEITFLNVGTVERPKWLVCRGTNIVERLHRELNALNLSRFSEPVGNALYVWACFRFSFSNLISRAKLDLLPSVLDLSLMDDVALIQSVSFLSFFTNRW